MSPKLLKDLEITPESNHPYGGINIYAKEFTTQGQELFNICERAVTLQPNHSVLDLGCGTGRILNYLKNKDVIGVDINHDYCEIAGKNNTVKLIDVYHPEYNPDGTIECKVGYTNLEDESFDRSICIAVLNHQYIKEAKEIIKELLRVTKKNGLILISGFFINKFTNLNSSKFKFQPISFESWSTNIDRPCLNSAFDESVIRKTIIENNGQIVEPIRYGQWRGQTHQTIVSLTGHDLIIIRKN